MNEDGDGNIPFRWQAQLGIIFGVIPLILLICALLGIVPAQAAPYSIDTYTGTGAQQAFPVTYPYISPADVKVTVNGAVKVLGVDYSFTSSSVITFTAAPASTLPVVFQRFTNLATPDVVYSGGAISSQALNTANLQHLYLEQEAYDRTLTPLPTPTAILNRVLVDSFGADPTGVNPSDAAFNAAIASFSNNHPGTVCETPGGTYTIANSITHGNGTGSTASTVNGVVVDVCDAEGFAAGASASIKWVGAANGIMYRFFGPSNGNALRHTTLNANFLAATGIQNISNSHADFTHVYVTNWTGVAIVSTTQCPVTAPLGGSGWDLWDDIQTIGPSGANASGMTLAGCAGSNVDTTESFFNRALLGYSGTAGTFGLALNFADGNLFGVVNYIPAGGVYSLGGCDLVFTQDPTLTQYPYGNTFLNYPMSPNGICGTSGTGGNFFPGYNTGGGGSFPSIAGLYGTSSTGLINGVQTVTGLLTGQAGLAVTGRVKGTYIAGSTTAFVSLATADPSPAVGDHLIISDASACTANTQVTSGGGTVHSCAVVYNGVGWLGEVTH